MSVLFPIDISVIAEVQEIRDALGIVALKAPTVCRLYLGADGEWRVRCDGSEERSFATRELALTAAKLTVARCAAYCLHVECEDGRVVTSQDNWPAPVNGAT